MGVIKEMQDYRTMKVEYEIDINTGKIEAIIPDKPDPITKIIFYRKIKNEVEQPITIKVDGEELQAMVPNSLREIKYEKASNSIQVCYGEKAETCEEIPLEIGKNNYIKCSYSSDSKETIISKVDEEKGIFEYAMPKKAEKRRQKKLEKNKKNE